MIIFLVDCDGRLWNVGNCVGIHAAYGYAYIRTIHAETRITEDNIDVDSFMDELKLAMMSASANGVNFIDVREFRSLVVGP